MQPGEFKPRSAISIQLLRNPSIARKCRRRMAFNIKAHSITTLEHTVFRPCLPECLLACHCLISFSSKQKLKLPRCTKH